MVGSNFKNIFLYATRHFWYGCEQFKYLKVWPSSKLENSKY